MATIIQAGGTGGISYSTDETEIGTWIDGRKVYRRVFNKGSAGFVSGKHNITQSVQDIDILIDCNFIFYANKWEVDWVGVQNRYLEGNILGITLDSSPEYSSSYIIATYVKRIN